jgi:hypothetical protein
MLFRSFSGAFHCPPAVDFCRFETITGVRHPEFVPWQLYLLLALFPGLPVAVALFCLFPCRDVCVTPVKRWYVLSGVLRVLHRSSLGR